MLAEERKALSKVRFEKAQENLVAAKNLVSSGDYKIASGRAYYAVFHAMRSVLALESIDMKHHSGVIAEFRRLYIKTGKFENTLSKTISELFDARTDSDYDDFYVISKSDTEAFIGKAEYFLEKVQEFLSQQ